MKSTVIDWDAVRPLLSGDAVFLLDTVGEDVFLSIMENFGGSAIYIPSKGLLDRIERDKRICEDRKKGATDTELARKYGFSVSYIRKITKKKYR